MLHLTGGGERIKVGTVEQSLLGRVRLKKETGKSSHLLLKDVSEGSEAESRWWWNCLKGT